jgi:Tol biopolymer transport system component
MCHFHVAGALTAVLALVLGAADVAGQGFSILSGRNHPELEWHVAETAHFRIIYPGRLAGIEPEAAAVAEASYAALAVNFETDFDRRIDIYLTDEDEIVNGFAVPIGTGHTNIWVHVADFARLKTGSEKWLRSVISHELAHIFHYRKVLDRPRWATFVLGEPLPRFWTEGIAQYYTEEWTSMRGDRWLRTAVLEDRLSYSDGRSLWNGRLLYAVGNAQVRYLAERFGDSTLVEILSHRRSVLFGLTRVHDFDAAFREVTGSTYRSFYDDWRRHVNVYYNTLASQLENVDSLDADPLDLPGQYVFDVAYSRDTTHAAVLSLASLQRPVQRLYVVNLESGEDEIVEEGSVQAPVAWSPNGLRIAYARLHRGRRGSLVRDLYIVNRDGTDRRRLTQDRRAGSPSFSPDGRKLAFAASAAGAENIHLLDLASDSVEVLTQFEGDVQVSSIRWHPEGDELLFDRFRADGRRDVAVLDLHTGRTEALTAGIHDDRDPVYGPGGTGIAYVSLRDHVPNVFVLDRSTGRHERVTNLATGAAVADWLPPDSLFPAGSLIVITAEEKSADRAYRIDAGRRAAETFADVPAAYAEWIRHRPPELIPRAPAPNPDLIGSRYRYLSRRNLRHVASLAVPYVGIGHDGGFGADWGIAGLTAWIEPLGKHTIAAAGGVSLRDPLGKSYVLASYVNNQWYPTVSMNLYRMPGSVQAYGDDLLVEGYAGGDVAVAWPLDWSDRPYSAHSLSARLRIVDVEALAAGSFDEADIAEPGEGQQADLRLALTWRKQRPYWNNLIHPLDGLGLRLQVTGAVHVLGTDTEFVRGDLAAYGVFRSIGAHRVFAYGRAQAQAGGALNQDFVGLSRHDAVRLPLPNDVPLFLGDTERVRGYRSYALGDRMLFGTVEYRVPFASGLRTTLLGTVSLGSLAGAFFADAGRVWTAGESQAAVGRLGFGIEVKNALRLGRAIRFAHAVGTAQPATEVLGRSDYEVYYRIRTTLPF